MSHAQRGPLAAFAALALVSATAVGAHMASANGGVATADSPGEIRIHARLADGPAPVLFGQRLLLGGGLPGQASASVDSFGDRPTVQQGLRRRGEAGAERSRNVDSSKPSTRKGHTADGRKGFSSKSPDISVGIRDDDGPRSEQEVGGVPPGNAGEPAIEPGKGKGNQNAKPDPVPVAPAPPPQQNPGNSHPQGPGSRPAGHDRDNGHARGHDRGPKSKARSARAQGKKPGASSKHHESRGAHAKKHSTAGKKKRRGKR